MQAIVFIPSIMLKRIVGTLANCKPLWRLINEEWYTRILVLNFNDNVEFCGGVSEYLWKWWHVKDMTYPTSSPNQPFNESKERKEKKKGMWHDLYRLPLYFKPVVFTFAKATMQKTLKRSFRLMSAVGKHRGWYERWPLFSSSFHLCTELSQNLPSAAVWWPFKANIY